MQISPHRDTESVPNRKNNGDDVSPMQEFDQKAFVYTWRNCFTGYTDYTQLLVQNKQYLKSANYFAKIGMKCNSNTVLWNAWMWYKHVVCWNRGADATGERNYIEAYTFTWIISNYFIEIANGTNKTSFIIKN